MTEAPKPIGPELTTGEQIAEITEKIKDNNKIIDEMLAEYKNAHHGDG